ncbi:hypothetical protein ACFV8Z_11930 [Streptomyces sp. NPDC059837]|uniref:hypothetical protein n=1 Tax=Streptomyces sp. NPDC059837 TaxID=3346968 RepID=UPI003646A89C
MRNGEKALPVLEALREREEEAVHGWVLDSGFLLSHQRSVSALESPGLVEPAGREDRAQLSAWEGRPVRWPARLTPPAGRPTTGRRGPAVRAGPQEK